jgi:hypothetical protein
MGSVSVGTLPISDPDPRRGPIYRLADLRIDTSRGRATSPETITQRIKLLRDALGAAHIKTLPCTFPLRPLRRCRRFKPSTFACVTPTPSPT